MAFTKITNSDLTNKGVIGLPDVPGLSTANMQNKLEETARDVIIPKHNGLIDELEDSTGASNIGAVASTGLSGTNVQALIDDLNLKKENNSSALPSTDSAGDNDTFNIRKSTTTYKITFSDLVASIKTAIGNATTSLAGLFSAEDKTKLDGIEANANDYTLPAATTSTLGGIKVGNNLQVTEDGTLSTASGLGDMLKSVYDTNDSGVVDSAESVAWSGVSSTPTTISGYGITDAYTKTEVDNAIPDDLADLNDDTTHRLVTDSDKTAWNGKIANGYKRVKVGTTNVDASGEDTIELIAGNGMTITPDATNKEITFTSTGGGTDVEGNPSGSATAGSLTKIKIDSDIYSVPQGTVTDAYKTIKVGSTSIDASNEDTFELKAGSNVTLTPDASTKSVTISATGGGQSSGDMLASDYDPNYTVKNTTGGITGYVASQIPTGQKGVIISNGVAKANLKDETQSALQSAAIQTAQNRQYAVNLDSNGNLSVNVPWENTTYSDATTSASGLMSDTDKTKLNGIEAGANAYTLPTASTSTLGGIKVDGTTITVDGNGVASAAASGTVDQTYNASSTNAQSGTAVAGAISTKADSSDLDSWTATATVQSNNTVTFTGLNDSYGYDLYCENKVLGISAMSKTGSGTSVSITYTVTGAASGDVCKLRILK